MTITRYTPAQAAVWDAFVRESKNGLFLFERGYMDYHSDRFADHSLLCYNGDELIALLPANEKDGELHSHGGLTYGGFVTGKRMSATAMLALFDALKEYARPLGLQTLYYKTVPYFFHRLPAGEDLYALFRNSAECYRRDASSLVQIDGHPGYAKGTKASLSKGRKAGLRVERSADYARFMAIEEEILQKRYGTKPTHTAEEIALLAVRFPDNIALYLVFRGEDECLGGTITFSTPTVMHTQYIGITDAGRDHGALDTLTDHLLQTCAGTKQYFSFGISTEAGGTYLNEGLIRNKESFGARTVVLDFYKMSLS